MCLRTDCPECGAPTVEACRKESQENCARDVAKCPTCGAAATEPCLEKEGK